MKKREFLIITSKRSKFSADIRLHVGEESIPPSVTWKSLGVIIDQHCDMETPITHTSRTAHFHLRNISAICDLLTQETASKLMHSVVTSRLDYCNSL